MRHLLLEALPDCTQVHPPAAPAHGPVASLGTSVPTVVVRKKSLREEVRTQHLGPTLGASEPQERL